MEMLNEQLIYFRRKNANLVTGCAEMKSCLVEVLARLDRLEDIVAHLQNKCDRMNQFVARSGPQHIDQNGPFMTMLNDNSIPVFEQLLG
jgi:hypothetical protein